MDNENQSQEKQGEELNMEGSEFDALWDDDEPTGEPAQEEEQGSEENKEPKSEESEEDESGGDEETDDAEKQSEQEEAGSDTEESGEEEPFLTIGEDAGTHTFSRDEVVPLVEKGMQYEAVSSERDNAVKETERLSGLESFLKELADPLGISIPELMDNTRAKVIAERDGIDESVALERAKLDRERAEFHAQREAETKKEAQAREAEEGRKKSFLRFAKEFPSVDPKTIPKDVWDRFNNGTDLADAYAAHENKNLRAQVENLKKEIETEKKNNENKKRSTGGAKDGGKKDPDDAFDSAWYDGT